MRRALVIFLVLLFPLNVAALCLSVASSQLQPLDLAIQAAGQDGTAQAWFADDSGAPSDDDVDTDEPPAAKDCNDSVQDRVRAAAPDPLTMPRCALASPGRGLLPFPPIKPPPLH